MYSSQTTYQLNFYQNQDMTKQININKKKLYSSQTNTLNNIQVFLQVKFLMNFKRNNEYWGYILLIKWFQEVISCLNSQNKLIEIRNSINCQNFHNQIMGQ
ncbi:hypothetical protein pb186bvf_014686 [Paramecium bursaria]